MESKTESTAEKMNRLKEKVLSQDPKTPRQEIQPVKEAVEEEPYTLWMGKIRKKNLKIMSARMGNKSMKDLINEAVLEKFPNIDKEGYNG